MRKTAIALIVLLTIVLSFGALGCTRTAYVSPTPSFTPTPTPSPTLKLTPTLIMPTLIVAASNSPNKDGADYQCDGTDDQVEIQAAINALPASGGKVVLLDGTFNISGGSYIDLTRRVTIEGQGNSTVLAKGSPPTKPYMLYARDSTSPHSDIEVRNLQIDCGNPSTLLDAIVAYRADGLVLQDLHIVAGSNRQGALYIYHSNQIKILDCVFEGIHVQVSGEPTTGSDTVIDSEDVLIQGCRWLNGPFDTFCIGNIARNFQIVYNDFQNCGYGAIDISRSPDSTVSYNTIDTCGQVGIYIEGGRNVVIGNNTITNSYESGIVLRNQLGLAAAGNITVQDNTLVNCHGDGIVSIGVPRVTIISNHISGLTRHGVLLEKITVNGLDYYADYCKVADNNIYNFGRGTPHSIGICLDDVRDAHVYGNYIDGNNNGYAAGGIFEGGISDHNMIENNTITGVEEGIYTSGPNSVVLNNTISPVPTTTPVPTPTAAPTLMPRQGYI